MNDLPTLITQQEALVESLKKRIAGIDAMLNQGAEERMALVADTIRAQGKLDGLQAALALLTKPAQEAKTEL